MSTFIFYHTQDSKTNRTLATVHGFFNIFAWKPTQMVIHSNGQKFHFITTKMLSWSKCVNDEQNILQECDNYYYEASLVFH